MPPIVSKEHHELCPGAGARSWVIRGDEVGTLENTDEGFKEIAGDGYTFTLMPSFAAKNGPVAISKVLLMKHESQLLALAADVSNCIIQADIETAKVVRIWTPKKSSVPLGMDTLDNETPAAQLDNRDTFMCLGQDSVSRWDLRAPPGLAQKLTNTGFRKYAASSQPNFSCMATAGDGRMVLGSRTGSVHLYAAEPLRQWTIATTDFNVGAPITALDITFDGHWVLATTDHFLVIAPTQFRTACGRRNGFEYTVQMHMEASSMRLVLGNNDAATVHGVIYENFQPFTKAHFNWVTEEGVKERRIAVSCGEYTAAFNWRLVKQAMKVGTRKMANHQLIQQSEYPSKVLDTAFMHDAFLGPGVGSQMGIVTAEDVFNVQFEDE